METPKDYIPSFVQLCKITCDYVKENQGEKGYIDVQNSGCDIINIIDFDERIEREVEYYVTGVRYNEKTRRLEVMFTEPTPEEIVHTEEDFKDEDKWVDLLHFAKTEDALLTIARNIDQYVDLED